MIENKPLPLSEALAQLKTADDQTRFWFQGEIPLLIKDVPMRQKAFVRRQRIMHYMKKHNVPFHQPWLTQLVLWEHSRGETIKSGVVTLKYLLLDDACRRKLTWTKELDALIDRLALEAYREHKEKART